MAVMALALLASCGGGDDPPPPQEVAFQSIQNQMTRSFPAGNYVFRTQAQMAAAWEAAPQQYGEAKPMPVVDFSQSMVVGISLGTGIRCGVPIVTSVTLQGVSYLVSYKSNDSGSGTLACMHQWYLTDFVVVPVQPGAVEIQRVPA